MNTKVGDLIRDQKLIVLSPNQTVHEALSIFNQHQIISAPIIDNNNVLGFIDILDILAFLVKVSAKMMHDTEAGDSHSLSTDDMKMLSRRSKEFKLTQVGDLIGKCLQALSSTSTHLSPFCSPLSPL
jgi:predicted transcriptional regulator